MGSLKEDELRAALALAGVRGLGPARYRALVDRFGSPLAALERSRSGGAAHLVTAPVRRRLKGLRPAPSGRLAELRARGIRLLAYGLDGYPGRLEHLHHPPPVLYLQGPLGRPSGSVVAMVGTRRATGYGRRIARDLAFDLASSGVRVVSGMARGIDGAAHRGALEAGGETLGVLGSGLDHEYPATNRRLFERVREEGALMSEFPPEEPPAPGLFPRRNRIIAALAEAVVVVQAPSRSGALITADHALELGREVFAVPGPVGPAASVGVHRLLREGAAPATCAEDVLRHATELERRGETVAGEGAAAPSGSGRGVEGASGSAAAAPGSALASAFGEEATAAAAILELLKETPAGADRLARRAGLAAGPAQSLLARMELDGYVRGLPGGRYELNPRRERPTVGR